MSKSADCEEAMTHMKTTDANRRKKWFQRFVTVIFTGSRLCGLYPWQWVSFWELGSHLISPPFFIITALTVPVILIANIVALREFIASITLSAIFRTQVSKCLCLVETVEPWIFTVNMILHRKTLMRCLRIGCRSLNDSSPRNTFKLTCHSLLLGPCSTLALLIFLMCLHDRHYDRRTLSERLSLIWVRWIQPIVYEVQYSTICLLYENSFSLFNESIVLLEQTQATEPGLQRLTELCRAHADLSNGVSLLNEYFSLSLLITVIRVRVTLMVDVYRSLSGDSIDVQISAVLYCWRYFLLCHRGQQLSTKWEQLVRQVHVQEICIDLNGMFYLNYNLLLATTATTLTYLITNMQFGGRG